MTSQYRIAVDAGGSFMLFILRNEKTGEIRMGKRPPIRDQLPSQFMKGLLMPYNPGNAGHKGMSALIDLVARKPA